MYHVYLLQSLGHNRFYVGVSHDLVNRLKKHNNSSSKSTKPYRPWIIIYSEEFTDKELAYKREWFLKHPQGLLEKQSIIKKHRKN